MHAINSNPHILFNIAENENETPGNCENINIKQKIKESKDNPSIYSSFNKKLNFVIRQSSFRGNSGSTKCDSSKDRDSNFGK
jgi:hypothetical protein